MTSLGKHPFGSESDFVIRSSPSSCQSSSAGQPSLANILLQLSTISYTLPEEVRETIGAELLSRE